MEAFGFDDGTTGRYMNEKPDAGNENCNNTCAIPRSETKTFTEFMGCTYNFTECFFDSAYDAFGFMNRTTSESVNRIQLKVYNDYRGSDILLTERMHLITDTDEVIGSDQLIVADATTNGSSSIVYEAFLETPPIGFEINFLSGEFQPWSIIPLIDACICSKAEELDVKEFAMDVSIGKEFIISPFKLSSNSAKECSITDVSITSQYDELLTARPNLDAVNSIYLMVNDGSVLNQPDPIQVDLTTTFNDGTSKSTSLSLILTGEGIRCSENIHFDPDFREPSHGWNITVVAG